MDTVKSFEPISGPSARILILGSMPGVKSLDAGQYYAHPRNAFWPIMSDLLGFDRQLPYQKRVDALIKSGVAVWDVLNECVRKGSLDSDIKKGSRVPNDFASFFKQHPDIQQIGFNGQEAQKSFNRTVYSTIVGFNIDCVLLPSSSPAHTLGLEEKMRIWRERLSL